MTLAEQYNELGNCYNPTSKEVRDFEAKFCVSDTVFKGAGWSGFSLIFADGSVWGLSHNLDLSFSYATHFHDKTFNA